MKRSITQKRCGTYVRQRSERKFPSPLLKLTKSQKKKIAELRKFTTTTNEFKKVKRIRKFCQEEKLFFYRYLKEAEWNEELAKSRVMTTLKWRSKFNPRWFSIHSMIQYVRKHKLEDLKAIFPYGYDKTGRPIVYMSLSEMGRVPVDEEGVKFMFKLMVVAMEDVLLHMPEGHTNYTLVLDVSNVGFSFGSVIKNVGSEFSKIGDYYSGILYRAFIVNSGWVIRGLWKIASLFMDTETVEKFTLGSDTEVLNDVINKKHIPSLFDGKDCEHEFLVIDYLRCLVKERKLRLLEDQKRIQEEVKKKKKNEINEQNEEQLLPPSALSKVFDESPVKIFFDDDDDDDEEEEEEELGDNHMMMIKEEDDEEEEIDLIDNLLDRILEEEDFKINEEEEEREKKKKKKKPIMIYTKKLYDRENDSFYEYKEEEEEKQNKTKKSKRKRRRKKKKKKDENVVLAPSSMDQLYQAMKPSSFAGDGSNKQKGGFIPSQFLKKPATFDGRLLKHYKFTEEEEEDSEEEGTDTEKKSEGGNTSGGSGSWFSNIFGM